MARKKRTKNPLYVPDSLQGLRDRPREGIADLLVARAHETTALEVMQLWRRVHIVAINRTVVAVYQNREDAEYWIGGLDEELGTVEVIDIDGGAPY